jgi:hypothetical protein
VGARREGALLEPLTPTPAIPEIVGIATLVACAIGGGKVAFPGGLVPLPSIASASMPSSMLLFAPLGTLNNMASSIASAPTPFMFGGARPGPTDGIAAPSCWVPDVDGLRDDLEDVGRAGPYDLGVIPVGGVPGWVPIIEQRGLADHARSKGPGEVPAEALGTPLGTLSKILGRGLPAGLIVSVMVVLLVALSLEASSTDAPPFAESAAAGAA